MRNQRSTRLIAYGSVAAFLLLLPIVGTPAGAQLPPAPCPRFEEFDPVDFTQPTPKIDNPWLPLTPGTQVVLEGTADRGGGALPHRVIFTVTSLTKVINGVRTRVMWDLDINEGRLSEAELAFFAQDDDGLPPELDDGTPEGNVWNIGEYPEEYEEETFVGAPNTWIHGIGDAEGGVHMKAVPVVSDTEYLQGWVPDIEFLDCAKVVTMTERTCVPVGCFEPVLVTHERSPLDPAGGIQTKFHAPGVGIVQIGAIDDPEGETLVLVQRQQLSRDALALVNREALRLDKRGYRTSEIYAQTVPIEPPRSAVARAGSGGWAQWSKSLRQGRAAWCVRALGPKLCRRWARDGSPIPTARGR